MNELEKQRRLFKLASEYEQELLDYEQDLRLRKKQKVAKRIQTLQKNYIFSESLNAPESISRQQVASKITFSTRE
jgi:hypothetical protein